MTTVGGAFHPSGTDAISVVTNSASGTKLDFYQKRTVSYDVQLGGGGTAGAALTVDLAERLPDIGLPALRDRSLQALLHGSRARTWRSSTSIATSAAGSKAPHVEASRSSYRITGPAATRTSRTTCGRRPARRRPSPPTSCLTQAWDGDDRGGTYRLSFVGQTTIIPTRLRVSIAPPAGMRFTSIDAPLTRDGDRAGLRGHAAGRPRPAGIVRPVTPRPDLEEPAPHRRMNGSSDDPGRGRTGPVGPVLK